MRPTDWHFDFVSPYSYLALKRLGEPGNAAEIRYHPVPFAGLLDLWGQKGPVESRGERSQTCRGYMNHVDALSVAASRTVRTA